MKKLLALILSFSLLMGTYSFGGEIVPSSFLYTSRSLDYVSAVIEQYSSSSGDLYYGFTETPRNITQSDDIVNIATNPSEHSDFVITGHKQVVTGSPVEIYLQSTALSPDKTYHLYATYKSEGINPSIYYSEFPSFNYITDVKYDNGDVNNKADDRILISFSKPYTLSSSIYGYINMGVDVSNPYYGIISLSGNYDFTFSQFDTDTISLNFTSEALAKFDDETDWSATESRLCKINLGDEADMSIFGSNGAKFDFTFSFDMLNYVAPPKLSSVMYENHAGFSNDQFILTFSDKLNQDLVASNLVITFDDKASGSYSADDYALSSTDFSVLKGSMGSSEATIILNNTAENTLKLLEYSSICKVTVINPSVGNPIVDSEFNSATTQMPGQNPRLKSISINGSPISGFNSNFKDYTKVLMYDDFNTVSSNPNSYIAYEAIDSGASVTVTSSVSDVAVYYTLKTTSKDGLQNDSYSVDVFKADNRLSGITINGTPLSSFSPATTSYTLTVDQNYVVPSISYTSYNSSAHVYTNHEGSLPGTYTYMITVMDNNISKTYEITFNSEYVIPQNENNDDDNTPNENTTNTTDTVSDNEKTVVEKATETATNTAKTIENVVNSTVSDPKAIDVALEKLNQTLENTKTDDNLAATAKSLTDLTTNLSNTIVSSSGTDQKATETVKKVSEYVEKIIVQINDPVKKVEQIQNFTTSIKTIKNSNLDSTVINKVVDDVVKNASKTLSKVVVTTKKEVGPLPKYVLDPTSVNTALTNVKNTTDQLNKVVSDYFGDNSYIQLKKEIQIDLQPTEEEKIVQVVIDSDTVNSLKTNEVQTINIKVQESELSLPSDSLNPEDNYEIVLSKSDNQSGTSSITPEISESMTNNSKFMEIDLFKNGDRVGNLSKPAKLTFDIEYFGYNEIEIGDDLSIYRFDEVTKEWEPVGGVYDPQSGTISVHRIHLSKYTVMKTKKTITGVDNTEVKDDVQALLNKGVIKTDTKDMKANITREEFVVWLGGAYGLTSSTTSTPFEDLDPNSESYKYIASVYDQGIISGKSSKSFGAGEYMTYEEVAVVLANTLTKLDNKKINNNLTAKLDKLGADIQISEWAKDEVALVIELGFLDKSVALNSKGYLTREQAAEIFSKFYS